MTIPTVSTVNLLLLFIVVFFASFAWRAGAWGWDKLNDNTRIAVVIIAMLLFAYVMAKG